MHVVEIHQFLDLETHGVAHIRLDGLCFRIDVGNHDDIFVGDFPEGLLLFLDDLVGSHFDVVIIRKTPALTHSYLNYKAPFKYFLNRDMYKTMTSQERQHKDFFYPQETMGTTIMALKYDGGVIACADSSTPSPTQEPRQEESTPSTGSLTKSTTSTSTSSPLEAD